MTNIEIVAALGEKVMGWTVVMFDAEDRKEGIYPRLVQQVLLDVWWVDFGPDRHSRHSQWNPLGDIHDAIEVQSQVALTRKREYLFRLREIISPNPIVGTEKLWWGLVNSTARQRCEAALLSIEKPVAP